VLRGIVGCRPPPIRTTGSATVGILQQLRSQLLLAPGTWRLNETVGPASVMA